MPSLIMRRGGVVIPMCLILTRRILIVAKYGSSITPKYGLSRTLVAFLPTPTISLGIYCV